MPGIGLPSMGGGDFGPPGAGPPGLEGGFPGMTLPGMSMPGGMSGGMPGLPGMAAGAMAKMPSMPGLQPDAPQLPGMMNLPGSMPAGMSGTMPGGMGGPGGALNLASLSALLRPGASPGGLPGMPKLPSIPGMNGASGGSAPSLPNMNWQQKPDGGNSWQDNNSWQPKGGGKGKGGGGWRDPGESVMLKDNEVRVQDPSYRTVSDFKPYETFADAPFPSAILDRLKSAGFAAPSQIQQYTWPLAMEGKDVIGVAATGSGKTLSFLLPAFAQIHDKQIPAGDPSLLVLAPTRELAIQIQEESDKFGKPAGFRTVCCYGGAPKPPQAAEISRGVHGVIGTPGRVNDFMEAGQLQLGKVMKMVLDEADRMLDMGFEPQIRKILLSVPASRQTLFYTATWPKNVRNIANEFMRGAYTVTVGNRDELKGNQDITQTLQTCSGYEKPNMVHKICQQAGVADPRNGVAKALIFCSTKKMCDNLTEQLMRKGVACAAIHGDKNQRDREAALNGLKEGRLKALVATDVAARGIDIKNVTLVINYDPPGNTEDYVHRIGRTGRAGQKGHAVALICERDTHALSGIMSVMKRTNQPLTPEFEEMARNAPRPPPSGKGRRDGPPPVTTDPNFKPGLCSGPSPSPPEVPEGANLPVAEVPAPTSDSGGGSGGDQGNSWGSYGGHDKWGGNDKWSGNNSSSRGYEDSNRGRDRDDRGRGDDRGDRGRGREDDRGRGGRRSPPRRRSPSRRRRRSPSRRNSRRSPSVKRKQRASSSGSSSSGDKKRKKRRSPSRKKKRSPSKKRQRAKSPSEAKKSPSPKRQRAKSPSQGKKSSSPKRQRAQSVSSGRS